MNKTVKSIAWICLVLGLLGIAVNVGLYLRARSFTAQIAERIEAGDLPAFRGELRNKEDSDEVNPKRRGSDFRERGGRLPMAGARPVFRDRFGSGLPLLFIATGPVLTVVGGVMLIVNREPKEKKAEEKPKKTAKQKA